MNRRAMALLMAYLAMLLLMVLFDGNLSHEMLWAGVALVGAAITWIWYDTRPRK